LPGGTDPNEKIFGPRNVRFLPKLLSGSPIAQFFDVCFVHWPLEMDGINPETYNLISNAALDNNSRMFWKLGQLVVEPMQLLYPNSFVLERDVEVYIRAPDPDRTSNLHGVPTYGPVIKILDNGDNTDNQGCAYRTSLESLISGLACYNNTYCQPRAVKSGNELVLNGGDPNHRLRFHRSGIYAVCYCEKWYGDWRACEATDEWVLVDKMVVSGPIGDQDWMLDIGFIQSFEIEGFGMSFYDTVRILEPDRPCDSLYLDDLDSSLRIQLPKLKGGYYIHGPVTNDTHLSDIDGDLRNVNTTYPPAYIESLTVAENGNTLLHFAEVPVLVLGDRITLDPRIRPDAPHFVRQRDLARIFFSGGTGHEIVGIYRNGLTVEIPMR
jgi:hypothetical protein